MNNNIYHMKRKLVGSRLLDYVDSNMLRLVVDNFLTPMKIKNFKQDFLSQKDFHNLYVRSSPEQFLNTITSFKEDIMEELYQIFESYYKKKIPYFDEEFIFKVMKDKGVYKEFIEYMSTRASLTNLTESIVNLLKKTDVNLLIDSIESKDSKDAVRANRMIQLCEKHLVKGSYQVNKGRNNLNYIILPLSESNKTNYVIMNPLGIVAILDQVPYHIILGKNGINSNVDALKALRLLSDKGIKQTDLISYIFWNGMDLRKSI